MPCSLTPWFLMPQKREVHENWSDFSRNWVTERDPKWHQDQFSATTQDNSLITSFEQFQIHETHAFSPICSHMETLPNNSVWWDHPVFFSFCKHTTKASSAFSFLSLMVSYCFVCAFLFCLCFVPSSGKFNITSLYIQHISLQISTAGFNAGCTALELFCPQGEGIGVSNWPLEGAELLQKTTQHNKQMLKQHRHTSDKKEHVEEL